MRPLHPGRQPSLRRARGDKRPKSRSAPAAGRPIPLAPPQAAPQHRRLQSEQMLRPLVQAPPQVKRRTAPRHGGSPVQSRQHPGKVEGKVRIPASQLTRQSASTRRFEYPGQLHRLDKRRPDCPQSASKKGVDEFSHLLGTVRQVPIRRPRRSSGPLFRPQTLSHAVRLQVGRVDQDRHMLGAFGG